VDVQLRELEADDREGIATYVALDNARMADSPWLHPSTPFRQEVLVRHGWDGYPDRFFLVEADGRPAGVAMVSYSRFDNFDVAGINALVAPAHRRRGVGTAAFEALYGVAGEMGRTTLVTDGWDHERTRGFATARGWEQKSAAVLRRQHLRELEPGLAQAAYDEAAPHAAGYVLERIEGRSPAALHDELAVATAAINDAPLDGFDFEDEVFSAARVAAYEDAQVDGGWRFRRIIARHRGSGEIAGLTIATVDTESPSHGHQHDTSVVRGHRGHRLGLLLKADMMRWLADAEPQLETIDTWNAESNAHMIAVNERLGYRALGRTLQYQRSLDA
jgi:RimJ/RimL family protein N-acetyltransferase